MSSNGSGENKVGYKKPPVATRFAKGKSGNPGGRPKGIRSKANQANDALTRRVKATVDGKRKWVSIEELSFLSLAAKAAQGDLRVIKQLLEWREPLVPAVEENRVIEFTLKLEEDDPTPHWTGYPVIPPMK